MRSLKDFILETTAKVEENQVVEAADSKIVVSFKELEKADETLKSLKDAAIKGVDVDEEGEKITVEVTVDNVDDLDTLVDIMQQYGHVLRNSQKRFSDESYAQKTVTFMKDLNKITDAIDEINGADEEPEAEEKAEEKKEEE